jgi:hypothetical protein
VLWWCLLLQDFVESCAREGEEDSEGHVLWDTTSRGLCGLSSCQKRPIRDKRDLQVYKPLIGLF